MNQLRLISKKFLKIGSIISRVEVVIIGTRHFLDKFLYSIEFKEVEYWFNARSYKGDVSFCTPNLNVVPRVGEEVQLTSFQALLGNTQFYVSSITHRFESGKQIITVFLDQGFYNKYWHFRKDKAVEEGEITTDDYYLKHDVLIKQKLGISRY